MGILVDLAPKCHIVCLASEDKVSFSTYPDNLLYWVNLSRQGFIYRPGVDINSLIGRILSEMSQSSNAQPDQYALLELAKLVLTVLGLGETEVQDGMDYVLIISIVDGRCKSVLCDMQKPSTQIIDVLI